VCWPGIELGKLCEASRFSEDVGLASSRGLSGRVVVARVACDLRIWQKPVGLLVLLLHLDWSLFWPLHCYISVSMLSTPDK
jgi:hypothetical protein